LVDDKEYKEQVSIPTITTADQSMNRTMQLKEHDDEEEDLFGGDQK